MTWLQFISSIVQSIAWPISVLVMLFMVRSELSALIPRVEKFKYKEFEIELKKAQIELSSTPIESLEAENISVVPTLKSVNENLYSLANLSPRAAILESWLQVEHASSNALAKIMKENPGAPIAIRPRQAGEFLYKSGKLTEAELSAFNRLKELRNRAVHLSDSIFKNEEVLEYIGMSNTLANKIRNL